MTSTIETMNRLGEGALHFAWPMLWQSSLLIVLLFGLDWALRKRVTAGVRYCLWLLVLVKLILPPTLSLPTGPAWWLRRPTPATPPTHATVVTYGEYTVSEAPAELPPVTTQPLRRIFLGPLSRSWPRWRQAWGFSACCWFGGVKLCVRRATHRLRQHHWRTCLRKPAARQA